MEDILEELKNVRPEVLKPEAKRLFDAIMKIADERDLYYKNTKKALEYIDSIDTGNFINESELKEIKKILQKEV